MSAEAEGGCGCAGRRVGAGSTVVVVGGGASGTLAAAQLLERGPRGLRVVVVERSGRIGPGVAYGSRSDAHRLNVCAAQMVAFPRRPGEFLRWARRHRPGTGADEYLPRHLFGDYLVEALDAAERGAVGRVALERRLDEATSVRMVGGNGGADVRVEVGLASGRALLADRVVVAIGNSPPRPPAGHSPRLPGSGLYVGDPWAPGALDRLRSAESVLLIGTGLTMVDVAISLAGSGGPVMHAVSRSGLVPRAHGPEPTVRRAPAIVPDGRRRTLAELTSALLAEVAAASGRGEDWRVAIDSIRPVTNRLWRSLSLEDRRRFQTDLSRVWSVHRHRMAPGVGAALGRLIEQRRLRVRAASVERIWPEDGGIRAELGPPGGDREPLRVDRAVNCMGPTYNPRRIDQPLVRSLLFEGLARPEPLGVGFDLTDEGALVGADGRASEHLFAIGPLRNGTLLETTAIPEIGLQAELLARELVGEGEAAPSVAADPVLGALGQPLDRVGQVGAQDLVDRDRLQH